MITVRLRLVNNVPGDRDYLLLVDYDDGFLLYSRLRQMTARARSNLPILQLKTQARDKERLSITLTPIFRASHSYIYARSRLPLGFQPPAAPWLGVPSGCLESWNDRGTTANKGMLYRFHMYTMWYFGLATLLSSGDLKVTWQSEKNIAFKPSFSIMVSYSSREVVLLLRLVPLPIYWWCTPFVDGCYPWMIVLIGRTLVSVSSPLGCRCGNQ